MVIRARKEWLDLQEFICIVGINVSIESLLGMHKAKLA